MVIFITVTVIALLTLLAVWFDGRWPGGDAAGKAEREKERASAFGFAGLGLAFGVALGLSSSPVLGASLAAGFALIGTLIPLYFPKTATADPTGTTPVPRLAPVGVWLFPFAVSTILGMVLGLALRVNDALDFRPQNLRERFLAQGFTEKQATDIMERLASSIHDPATAQAAAAGTKEQAKATEPGLQTAAAHVDWKDYWARMDRLGFPPNRVLAEFKKIAPPKALGQIEQLEAESAKEILKTVRRDNPEIGG